MTYQMYCECACGSEIALIGHEFQFRKVGCRVNADSFNLQHIFLKLTQFPLEISANYTDFRPLSEVSRDTGKIPSNFCEDLLIKKADVD